MRLLTIHCPEGWSYIGWQRVIATDPNGNNASKLVATSINLSLDGELPVYFATYQGELCLFVQSGESFTLEDFADFVGSLLKTEVLCKDGP